MYVDKDAQTYISKRWQFLSMSDIKAFILVVAEVHQAS